MSASPNILRILATLLPNFLSRGGLVAATSVLQELRPPRACGRGVRRATRSGIPSDPRPDQRAGGDRGAHPGALRRNDPCLGFAARRVSPVPARRRFGPATPGASETVDHKELQAVLREAVQGIAAQNRSAVVALLDEEDPVLAAGAARLAGEVQITEAGPALASLLTHADPSVRLAAVEAAIALKASTAAGSLEITLGDSEREVRIAAARALGALKYRPAAKTLEGIVKGREIRSADITEKVAVFEAYGIVAEEDGLDLLDSMLNGKGFLGKREPTDIRAAAALALGRIPGPRARSLLEKATRDEDPVVRSNVNRALRDETET